MAELVLPLDLLDASLALVGGKAAGLARLIRSDFPVPEGFVVSTAAYQALLEANGLGQRIVAAARWVEPDDPDAAAAAARTIRELFARAVVPPGVAVAVANAYHQLASDGADVAVAVRSSATAEDLPEASFAGQQETYLNVVGEAALLEAVKRCSASLWTERAIAYRARQGIDPVGVSLAVVVQRLVPAEVSGVLFTVNPTTGDPSEVVVNASWGLGEAIVGGKVSPDTFVADKATGEVRQTIVGAKAVMVVPCGEGAGAGTADVEVSEAKQAALTLTPDQVTRLVELGRDIERHFGGAQDVEWAISQGEVYILQARPVTGLPTRQSDEVPGDDAWPPLFPTTAARPCDLWTRADVGERWPEAVTPLTWSLWEPITQENMRYSVRGPRARSDMAEVESMQWSRRAYGRVYLNEGALGHALAEAYGFPASLTASALGSGVSPAGQARTHFRPLRLLRRTPLLVASMRARLRNERVFEALWPEIDRWVGDFLRRDPAAVSDAALWDELDRVWMPRCNEAIDLYADVTSSALLGLPMLEGLTERWLGRKELAGELLAGLSGVIAAEIVPSLARLAAMLRELGLAEVVLDRDARSALAHLRERPEAAPALVLLDEFLARHGHRCASEAEIVYPRWVEAPEQVIESIASYLRAGSEEAPGEAEARQQARRAETIAKVEHRLDPIRRGVLRSLLGRVERLVRLRDNGQHYMVKLLLPIRRIYAILGERWAARGWLADTSDVFFLSTAEVAAVVREGDALRAGLDLRTIVSGRRQAYGHWLQTPAPAALASDGQPLAEAPDLARPVLTGIAASAGRARGVARVMLDPREATRLRKGDILVTRATDPGWTPAFYIAGGLVVEIGGQLSHAAIVAREYGLPAVVNVRGAVTRIRDGEVITVDGTGGRVYLGAEPAEAGEEAPGPAAPEHRRRMGVIIALIGLVGLAVVVARRRGERGRHA